MIIKREKITENIELIYHLNNTHLVIIKKENNTYEILKEIPILKTEKKPKHLSSFRKILYSFGLLFLLNQVSTAQTIVMKPEIVSHYFLWSNLSRDEKGRILKEDNEEMLKNNQNLTEIQQKALIKQYEKYIDQYIDYFTPKDYRKTLTSSLTVKIKPMKVTWKETETNMVINYGKYNRLTHIIYSVPTDFAALFHEKIHSDDPFSFIKFIIDDVHMYPLLTEMKASVGSEAGYTTLVSMFDLLNELVGKDIVLQSIFEKNEKILFQRLQETFPNREQEIEAIKQKILELYSFYNNPTDELDFEKIKKEFLQSYQVLYREKYGFLPTEDLVSSYEIDMLNGYVPYRFGNSEEKELKLTNNISGTEDRRHQNYRDFILSEIYSEPEKGIYLYFFIKDLNLCFEKWTFEEFKSQLHPYFTNDEIIFLFNELAGCYDERELKSYEELVRSRRMSQK